MRMRILSSVLVLIPCLAYANPGRIVVNYDDWTVSSTGFNAPCTPGIYVGNIAAWFTGGEAGSFLGLGGSFHLGAPELYSAFAAFGHAYVRSEADSLDLAVLQNYDGVFLGAKPLGDKPANVATLTTYVQGGGNVYLYGGTNYYGSIAADAIVLNSFLNPFGLDFASAMTVYRGTYPLEGDHPVLAGVDYLFTDNGTAIFDLDPVDASSEVLALFMGDGVIAVYDGLLAMTSVRTSDERTGGSFVRPYPNPASGSVSIRFARTAPAPGSLRIYDLTGRLVRSLVLGEAAGSTVWDGTDSSGRDVAPGVYFLRLTNGARDETARLIFVR